MMASSFAISRPDQPLVGYSLVLLLTLTAFLGSVVLLPPGLFLLFLPMSISRKVYRVYTATYGAMWFAFAAGLLEYLGGIRIRITGDPLPYGERVMLIMNHRTRIDWMFVWCLAARYGFLRSIRVVLKSSLKALPFFGWAMQSFLFIFLDRGSRNRDGDLDRITSICTYLVKEREVPNTLLLFPEGTDLSQSNLEKDTKFAQEKGYSVYTQVLHPRTLGFITAMTALRGHLDAIYDITVAYVDYQPGERPSEVSVLKGRLPQEVHFHVKRHDISSVPTDSAGLEALLRRSFDTKQELLTRFYGKNSFSATTEEVPPPLSSLHSPLPPSSSFDHEQQALAAFRLSCLGWFLLFAMTAYVASRRPLSFTAYVVSMCLFLGTLTRFGGVDGLELRLPLWGVKREDEIHKKVV